MKIINSRSRSFAKAFSWRFFATVDTFIISYFVILHFNYSVFQIAGLIACFEIITKVVIYFFHERLWENIEWGKNN